VTKCKNLGMGQSVKGGMWCANCGRAVMAVKNTHRFTNLLAIGGVVATGGISNGLGAKSEAYICNTCGGTVRRTQPAAPQQGSASRQQRMPASPTAHAQNTEASLSAAHTRLDIPLANRQVHAVVQQPERHVTLCGKPIGAMIPDPFDPQNRQACPDCRTLIQGRTDGGVTKP
jgi:DNA-directed RNA polymerase subunit RPC12/RpoP